MPTRRSIAARRALWALMMAIAVTNSARGDEYSSVVELSARLRKTYEAYSPAVVRLTHLPVNGRPLPAETAVIVSAEGLMLTSSTACAWNRERTQLTADLPNGKRVLATKLGWSREWGIGMARLDEPGPWPCVKLATDDRIETGRFSITLDYPQAYGLNFDPAPMLRFGLLSTVCGTEWFTTSTGRVDWGSSQMLGSAVFDLEGDILGVTSRFAVGEEPHHTSAATIRHLWNDLLAGKNIDRERLVREGRAPEVKSFPQDSTVQESPIDTDGPQFSRARAATVRLQAKAARPTWSGVIVSAEGLIVTCGHIYLRPGTPIIVSLPDGRDAEGEMLGTNWVSDVSLVRITEPGPWPAVSMGNSLPLSAGDVCVRMGFPHVHTEREPYVSQYKVIEPEDFAWGADLFMEPNRTLPGHSGGGIFDSQGELVAVYQGGTDYQMHTRIEVVRAQWKELLDASRMKVAAVDEALAALNREISQNGGRAEAAVVQIHDAEKRLAVGIIVDSRGSIVTKASELDGSLECRLSDGTRLPAKVQRIDPLRDLALLKIEGIDLPVVEWADDFSPSRGDLVTTLIPDRAPAITPVSYPMRAVQEEAGHLPLPNDSLADSPRGLTVIDDRLLDGSKSPFRAGDIVASVGKVAVPALDDYRNLTARPQGVAGNRIDFVIRRGETTHDLSVPLAATYYPRPYAESRRSSGFPQAFDLAINLTPRDCGSPILNARGQVVGVVIARKAGERVYALPVHVLREFVGEADDN